jgi:hypothetical protein
MRPLVDAWLISLHKGSVIGESDVESQGRGNSRIEVAVGRSQRSAQAGEHLAQSPTKERSEQTDRAVETNAKY